MVSNAFSSSHSPPPTEDSPGRAGESSASGKGSFNPIIFSSVTAWERQNWTNLKELEKQNYQKYNTSGKEDIIVGLLEMIET